MLALECKDTIPNQRILVHQYMDNDFLSLFGTRYQYELERKSSKLLCRELRVCTIAMLSIQVIPKIQLFS
jgi:hypothetical protein